VLLSINGKTVNRFRAVEEASQVPVAQGPRLARRAVLELEIPTVELGSGGVERVVSWAGALLQPPHRAMAAQRGIEPTGVFVAFHAFGSPASRNGLGSGRRIVEVDGRPTPDLDAFLEVVAGRADREAGAPARHQLERPGGSRDAEARQALLAGLRAGARRRRPLAAARPLAADRMPPQAHLPLRPAGARRHRPASFEKSLSHSAGL
jgi:hypothetical protein